MEILVAGAHGSTGQRILDLLAKEDHTVRGMIRDADQAPTIESLGATPVVADLEGELTDAVKGCDAVIFAAGSGSSTGPDKTIVIDQEAAKRLVDTAVAEGARRFVMLSSMGTRNPDEGPEGMQHYFHAKRNADDHLRESSLDWTVVRPGGLTDDDGTGMIEAAERIDRRGSISRDDVAAVIVQSLREQNTVGRTFEILEGDELIGAALKSL